MRKSFLSVLIETHYRCVTTNNRTSWTTATYTVTFKYLYDQDRYAVKKVMFLPGDINPSYLFPVESNPPHTALKLIKIIFF